MTLQELAKLASSVRDAQRRYFRDRSPQNLNMSKDWERRLDAAVQEILEPQNPGLFDEKIKEQQ